MTGQLSPLPNGRCSSRPSDQSSKGDRAMATHRIVLIDDETGRIYDVEWDDVKVSKIEMRHFEINDYSVVMHGRRKHH